MPIAEAKPICPDTIAQPRIAIIIDGFAFNQKDVDVVNSDTYYNKQVNDYFFYEECSQKVSEGNDFEKLSNHIKQVHQVRIAEQKLLTDK